MIVIDASAVTAGLLNDGPARGLMAAEPLHTPHLVDSEIAGAMRRLVQNTLVASEEAWRALDSWRRLAVTRYPAAGLLKRIWALRDHLSAYDATYVALAESLDCALVTADARLSNAPQLGCPITVVPH